MTSRSEFERCATLQLRRDRLLYRKRASDGSVQLGVARSIHSLSKIAGCERCGPEQADIPLDWILADVLDKLGPFVTPVGSKQQ